MSPKTYEISAATINEAMEKIPPDRLGAFLCELVELTTLVFMARAKAGDGVRSINDPITWIDDGKGEVALSISDLEGRVLCGPMTIQMGGGGE